MSERLLRITNLEELAAKAKFDPGDFAALCLVSLRELERHFRKRHHKTPRTWLRELRCSLALPKLKEGYSTKAIAGELYFSSEAEFCHQFKKVYGKSPQHFAPLPPTSTRIVAPAQ